jgi:hypothetical protein
MICCIHNHLGDFILRHHGFSWKGSRNEFSRKGEHNKFSRKGTKAQRKKRRMDNGKMIDFHKKTDVCLEFFVFFLRLCAFA